MELSGKMVDELVRQALERGTGARGLNALVEELMEPLLFRLAVGNVKKDVTLREGVWRYVG